MWQQTIVGLIVAGAASWAAWYWMPAAWRRSLAGAAGRGAQRMGVADGRAAQVAQSLGDAPGCSSCDSCGSCATPGDPAGTAMAAGRAEAPPRPVNIVRKS